MQPPCQNPRKAFSDFEYGRPALDIRQIEVIALQTNDSRGVLYLASRRSEFRPLELREEHVLGRRHVEAELAYEPVSMYGTPAESRLLATLCEKALKAHRSGILKP
jgi:hypothetical protein